MAPSDETARQKHLRQRLESRFPGVHHPSLTDKDQEHLTSDRRIHMERRTFFLGEVFWAEVSAFDCLRHLLHRAPAQPALVTEQDSQPGNPVIMAPPTRYRPEQHAADPGVWQPQEPGKLRPETAFLLRYRRPVRRDRLGGHLATLTGKDKQHLANALAALKRGHQ